jgi:hypothetical protein
MGSKKLWISGLLFTCLLGLVFWDQWKSEKEGLAEKEKNRLLAAEVSQVEEIELTAKKDGSDQVQVIKIVKSGKEWVMTQPLQVKADMSVVQDFLTTVGESKFEKVVAEDDSNWAEFGLTDDNFTAKVSLYGAERKPLGTLHVGQKAPVGYSVYLRGQGPQVYLVSQHIGLALSKGVNDFRDRTVIALAPDDVVQVTVEDRATASLELNKNEGIWVISRPAVLEADQEVVKEFLRTWAELKASNFVDEPSQPLKSLAQDSAQSFKVSFMLKDSGPLKASVTEFEGRSYVVKSDGGSYFEIEPSSVAGLRKTLTDFQNRRVFLDSFSSLQRLTIDGVIYERREEDWFQLATAAESGGAVSGGSSETAPGAGQAGTSEGVLSPHIASLLLDLEFLKTDQMIEPGVTTPTELANPPNHILVLQFAQRDQAPVEVKLWQVKEDEKRFYLQKSTSESVYRVDSSMAQGFKPDVTSTSDFNENPRNLETN